MTKDLKNQHSPAGESGLLAFGETFIDWNGELTNIKNLPEYEYEMFLERMRAFRVAHYVIKKHKKAKRGEAVKEELIKHSFHCGSYTALAFWFLFETVHDFKLIHLAFMALFTGLAMYKAKRTLQIADECA